MASKSTSLLWVIIGCFAVITLFGWALLAASYAHAEEGWRSEGGVAQEGHISRRQARQLVVRETAWALLDFVGNAFRQIPNAPWVVAHAFTKRLWLVLIIVALQALVVFGGWKLQHLEKQLQRKTRRKPRKLATPKGTGEV